MRQPSFGTSLFLETSVLGQCASVAKRCTIRKGRQLMAEEFPWGNPFCSALSGDKRKRSHLRECKYAIARRFQPERSRWVRDERGIPIACAAASAATRQRCRSSEGALLGYDVDDPLRIRVDNQHLPSQHSILIGAHFRHLAGYAVGQRLQLQVARNLFTHPQ